MAGKILRRSFCDLCRHRVLFCVAAMVLTFTERGRLKQYLVTALGERFHSDVQIRDITRFTFIRGFTWWRTEFLCDCMGGRMCRRCSPSKL